MPKVLLYDSIQSKKSTASPEKPLSDEEALIAALDLADFYRVLQAANPDLAPLPAVDSISWITLYPLKK